MDRQLRIGTSGWSYKDWVGRFYPEGLPSVDQLGHYSRRYDTVELNSVFYHMPRPESVKNWYQRTPKDFIFAYKASRFITHIKKLADSDEPLRLMFKLADLLKEKLGPILYQLPPSWPLNLPRLKTFLGALPSGYDHVMEFRHPSWFSEDVYALLEKHHVSLCLYDMKSVPSPERFTGPLAYLRMHGAQEKYAGGYSTEILRQWASKINHWLKDKRRVFVYFNNDLQGHAIANADELKRILHVVS